MRSTSRGAPRASLVGLFSLLLARSTQAAPTLSGVRGMYTWMDDVKQTKQPVLNLDFPDPSLIEGPNQWYAFATASSNLKKHKLVQYATAPAPAGPWTYINADLLNGNAGKWTNQYDVWAPDVRMVDDGTYVLYYTAALAGNSSGTHCLGVATANKIEGPWQVDDEAWHCDAARGGSIDSSGFKDSKEGTRYVVYKIDGNSVGNGGDCSNSVAPIQSTPIMLQQVAGDGTTKIGGPVQILDRTDADGPLVEAPNIVRASNGKYVLFYSSHCFTSRMYNVLYATADKVTGPYTRASGSFLETGLFNLSSPGGGTSAISKGGDDKNIMLFHANCPTAVGGSNRCMFASSFMETGKNILANR